MADTHLYHYCKINAHGLSLLLNSRFYCSAPAEVNDPFDSKGIFLNQGELSDYEYHYRLCSKRQTPGMSEEERTKGWKAVAERLTSDPQYKEHCFGDFRQKAIQALSQLHMVCFCKKCRDIRMWSHYADKHKGMCLKFDRQLLEAPSKLLFEEMRYSLPTFSDLIDVLRKDENVGRCLAVSKAPGWKYEAEVRMVVPVKEGETYDGLDATKKFFSFDPKALTGIIFGCETSEEDKQTVFNIFKDRSHCPKFSVASASTDRYKLTFKDWVPETSTRGGAC